MECKNSRRINPPRIAGAGLVLLLALLGRGPALYSESAPFDPASVQAPSCRAGTHDCGYIPLSGPEVELIAPSDGVYVRPRGMPGRLDLTPHLPPVGNQGQQNSCLGWALGYGLKSYYERLEHGWEYDSPLAGGAGQRVFSPAFIYNQINGGQDRGATPREAFRLLVRRGASPWALMPYREDDYRSRPGREAASQALEFRSEDFRRVSCSDVKAIKSELYRGHPVMMGIRTHLNFYQLEEQTWENHEGRFFGGHAVLITGYDDGRRSDLGYRGAFKMYNSFGTEWGADGLGWVAYDFLPRACIGAYVLRERGADESVALLLNRRGIKTRSLADVVRIAAPSVAAASRGAFADHVELRWDRVPGAIAYRVQRDDGAGFRTIGLANENGFKDTDVRQRVSYMYRVIAVSDTEISEPGRTVRGYARERRADRPAGPVWGLNGSFNGRLADLRWSAAQGALRHEVARWDEGRGRWRTLSRNARTAFRDARARAGAVYYYRVRGLGRRGAGSWSAPVAVRTDGVTGLRASRGTVGRITVDFARVPGAREYLIRRFDRGGTLREFRTRTPGFQDDSEEIQSGAGFRYYVAGVNAAGTGRMSGPVVGRARTSSENDESSLPPPAGIRVKSDSNSRRLLLTWAPVSGAREYRVYRQRGVGGDVTLAATRPSSATEFSAELAGSPGTLYFYTIRTVDPGGLESASSRALAAEVLPPRVAPRAVRPFNGGLRRFTGRWSAFTFERGKQYPLELFIAYRGHDFRATLKSGGRTIARFEGDYIARDRELKTRNFRMELDESGNSARVFLRARGPAPDGKEIVFVADAS